jgi:uncharacterized membrane protein
LNAKLKTFAICSVILNIFLIGFLVGKFAHKDSDNNVAGIVENLAPTKQEIARKLFPPAKSPEGTRVGELNSIKKGLVAELNAEEFDAKEYQRKLDELERVRAKLREHYTLAVKEMATNFTVEERRSLVRALVKRRPSRAGRSPFSSSKEKN